MNHIDTIILGLGAMGSAAAWACAQRGQRVLGFEQFPLVHDQGSSHGQSRIIREAYYEHPAYVPLVRKAYQHWGRLEQETGQQVLTRCCCANIGQNESEIIQGVKRASQDHSLQIEVWNADQIEKNIPALRVPDDYVGLIETNAGWLKVEECVRCMQTAAQRQCAILRSDEKVTSWACTRSHVEVTTNQGSYKAERLIITAGPWSGQVMAELKLPLHVMRQLQLWFTPLVESAWHFCNPQLPIFMVEAPIGHFYGIPSDAGPGVKIAQHYGAPELQTPDQVQRQLSDSDLVAVRGFLRQFMPSLAYAPMVSSAVCIYTLSPDRHFMIDRHPHHERVVLATGFSGHGFKFAPVVGEMLADLLEGKVSKEVETLFTLRRFRG